MGRDKVMGRIATFLRDERAVSSTEYAVLLALILAALIGTVQSLGYRLSDLWNDIMADLKAVDLFG